MSRCALTGSAQGSRPKTRADPEVGADEPQQHHGGGGFASTVGAEESVDFTGGSRPSSARVLPKSFTSRVVSITGCDGAFMVCPFLRSSCERPKRSPTAFRSFHPGADLASRLSGPQHTSAKPREEGPDRVPTCAQGTDIPMTWGQALGGVKKSLWPASKPMYDGYPVL